LLMLLAGGTKLSKGDGLEGESIPWIPCHLQPRRPPSQRGNDFLRQLVLSSIIIQKDA